MASDAELIAASLAGDGEAFVEVIHRHEVAVGAYLVRRAGRELAEDLLGEVWMAAFGSRAAYDQSFPGARPWLFGVAQLRPTEREVLTLVAWEDLTVADAARALGIPAGTARRCLHQARQGLRNAPGMAALMNDLNTVKETMGHPRPVGRKRRTWAIWSTAGLGIAASAVAVTLVIAPAAQPASPGRSAASAPAAAHAHAPLMRLAAAITAKQTPLPGDATLIIRTQVNAQGQSTGGGADLYTDSGAYYYAPAESGLPQQIAEHSDIGGGGFARELAAARYAVNGDLAVARQRMAIAMLDPNQPKLTWRQTAAQRAASMDNEIWENSLDALQAGAGQPEVRAGVLRLLSTLPEVTVRSTDVNGAAMLTLTATAPAMPANYQETLTINGTTGVPVNFAGGVPGHRPDTTSTYRVSRVTVTAIAAGRF